MKDNLKIAIYSGEIPSTTFIERLILGLSDKGCKILLFGYVTKKIKYKEGVIIRGYADNRWYKMSQFLRYSVLLFLFRNTEKKKLDEYIAKEMKKKTFAKMKYYPVLWHKPHIFHLQWTKSVKDWIWVQDFGIKLVVSLRGTHITTTPLSDLKVSEEYKKYFPRIDGFHAVSEALKKEGEKYGADSSKIKVVYSGLSEADFVDKKRNQDKVFKIISVGRNHWIKGYSYALDSCKILKENQFEFEYTIIGASGAEELEFVKEKYKLSKEVIFTGNKSFNEVQESIKNADLLLLPSIEEGIANTVLEAMQLGTIVLTTNCGGMSEVIKNGKNGFIVPIRDPQMIAESIMNLASMDQKKSEEIIKEAFITIQNNHSEKKMITDMISLYNDVLNNAYQNSSQDKLGK
ncbi:glycosyltransferase family 4 protein [Flavobacterium terrae]|uniref:Colanic acid/amylovoran biosynthesis glycosyltransferase n=1 Tax=Flavobacterium terrae TaxID=415425 RepID=A0A1M6FRE6_9FLAO|nr:glycosyltransferase family 4 protein [Flavobacterium terrae]SHJ00199.1 colanic acid/amylovoran biosynthesis glycosyltransferase [Flavobacterium terrae]